jgi:hypothetical protein
MLGKNSCRGDMKADIKSIIEQFVDYLSPELTPYEISVYLGKRTIAAGHGKASRGEKTSYAHVTEILSGLEEKGCIKVGDTNRDGTLYIVILPKDIPLVAEKIASSLTQDKEADYFNEPEKRREIFERDNWICQYCGEKVTQENATLDHFIPQSKGGKSSKDNLKTCCLICNSIKSGKSYEEAAGFLLKSIQERKARSHK